MIARPTRAWLEPFLWFLPALIGVVVIFIAALSQASEPGLVVLGSLTLVATDDDDGHWRVARPVRYQKALRPRRHLPERPAERHGPGRAGPDLPEHPPVPEHDRDGERPGRDAHPAQGQLGGRDAVDPQGPGGGAVRARDAPASYLKLVGLVGKDDE